MNKPIIKVENLTKRYKGADAAAIAAFTALFLIAGTMGFVRAEKNR